jgi:hypothetical protein
MTKKDLARSINAKLINISREKQIAFQNIQISFLLERMVARLTNSKVLKDKLVFKGGYVAFRIFDSPRYTIDLDAFRIHRKTGGYHASS